MWVENMKLRDKVAIVTGSSRGLGKAIALAFARKGAKVVVAARTEKKSRLIAGTIYQTAKEIEDSGGIALPVKMDVANEKDVSTMVQRTMDTFKHIDILVANAATNRPASFLKMPLKIWDEIIRVNIRGVVLCVKAVLPAMMEQGEGHIITISSVAAENLHHEPFTGLAYDVSKAGINRFSMGLAEELKPKNIAVNVLVTDNTVTEGWSFLNPQVDKSRWSKPEEWGRYAAFVASQNPARFTGKILSKQFLQNVCSSEM
jgi:NAD(P)-dependent dehydrogenase (short-subunit alcohol dehydrogenase family)